MRGVKKSRNGCLTCKEKKVRPAIESIARRTSLTRLQRKCDEKKPACSRCVNSNLVCPGYAQKIKWRTVRTPQNPAINQVNTHRSDARYKFMRTLSSPVQSDSSEEEIWKKEPSLEDSVLHPDGSINTSTMEDFPFLNLYPRDGELGPLWDHAYNYFTPFEFLDPLSTANETVELPLSPVSAETCLTPEPSKNCTEENAPSEMASSGTEFPISDNTRKALVDFYLEEVAGTLSCFDGPLNPFRNSVASLLETSPALASTAQSMAAACLAQTSHKHRSLADQLRQEADARVQEIIERGEPDSTTVLTLLMLGCSAEWHDPNDHGEKYWAQSLELLQALSVCMEISAEDHYFFRNALTYWRLSNSFGFDDEILDTLPAPLQNAQSMVTWSTPHPWTGVSEVPIRLLGRVSNLLKSSGSRFTPESNVIKLQEHLQEAARLERELLRLRLPDEDLILDPRDERTPTSHLIQVGEVYRLCGLVRLYRGFPHLLCRSDYSVKMSSPSSTSSSPLQTFGIPATGASGSDANGTIRDMTKRALGILERIPLDSGVRLAQPFLLTTLASELRLSFHDGDALALPSVDMEVLRARRFVTSRLSALDAHIPPYRMNTMVDFVKRIWEEMDADDG
ncbi:hypothetical protein BK809_0002070 [Diplodia seriata]|uniref:Zn(2)-C6 fungal-type domain-containing protein n=1 Tax=Diplodia seriata TaxID=420778 RepID=A0A1S8BEV9_9PEZI|nr:hypothetical protein BK809_0002070 [Diplodia seriata]